MPFSPSREYMKRYWHFANRSALHWCHRSSRTCKRPHCRIEVDDMYLGSIQCHVDCISCKSLFPHCASVAKDRRSFRRLARMIEHWMLGTSIAHCTANIARRPSQWVWDPIPPVRKPMLMVRCPHVRQCSSQNPGLIYLNEAQTSTTLISTHAGQCIWYLHGMISSYSISAYFAVWSF